MRKVIILIHVIMLSVSFSVHVYSQEFKERITNSAGMEFVFIKPGTFQMGSPKGEPGRFPGETLHTVNLTHPFYMQTTEVTQAQWQAVMDTNPSSHKRCGDSCPVEQVSWEDTQKFIQKLNAHEGTEKYRLPTEAEWEYACQAGNKTALSNGPLTTLQCDLDDNLNAICWY